MKLQTLALWLIFGLLFSDMHAQQAITASGKDISGAGGTVSYSVGQIAYMTNSSSEFTMVQGVQQPFEISEVLSIADAASITLAAAYPNPVDAMLTLDTGEYPIKGLTWSIYDLTGKTLLHANLYQQHTPIPMAGLQRGVYFLHLSGNGKTLKTFKIIKN